MVASFRRRVSPLKPSTIQLSEVPNRGALANAIECGWRLPRLVMAVVDRESELEIGSLPPSTWKATLDEELPSALLLLQPPLVVLGFYHQRWISAYVPKGTAAALSDGLLQAFRDELLPVDDEL